MSEEMQRLYERIDRLESLDQIRQLPAKYALCVDMRDFDSLVNLFTEDYRVSKTESGRVALKKWYANVLRGSLIGSAHGINGHVIDFESPDLATGLVYSRNDLEHPDVWMHEIMCYLDRYERRGGIWYFQRRTPLYWFQCDALNPPVGGGEAKLRWEGMEWQTGGFHSAFPTWAEFWDGVDHSEEPVRPPAPLFRFINELRRGAGNPKVRIDTSAPKE